MLKRFFITGTDTSVGKTVVSRALLQALASQGKTVAGYKPVAKGSKETPEGLRNKDALVLQSVSTIELPYEAVNPIALSEEESSVMVVGIQEGCINHALLTAQAIANDGLPLIGWVANRINPGLAHYAEIIDVLGKKLPAPLIGELPYLPRAEQRELGQYIRLAMLRSVLAVDRVTV